MKIFKYALWACGALAALAAALIAYVAATFDPNDYKPQIVQLVKERQNRTLGLEGDIRLSFWPNVGAELGRLSLSEHGGEREFARIESARVSVKLLPLLARRVVVVDEIALKGAHLALVRHKDGRMNIEDLLAPGGEPATAIALDIAQVRIENAALAFRDEASGTRIELSRLDLKTGRIAAGVPTPVELSAVASGGEPEFRLGVELRTRLALDPARGEIRLEALGLEAKGEAAGLRELALKATGSLGARLGAGEYSAERLSVAASGASGKERFEVGLEAPELSLAPERTKSGKLSATAKLTGAHRSLHAALSLPALEGTARAIRSEALGLDLDFRQGDFSVKAALASALEADAQSRRLAFPRLKASLTASAPAFVGKSFSGELAGSAAVDLAKHAGEARLAGQLAESSLKARLAVAGFAPPAVSFDIAIDQLDLDRFLPAKGAGTGPAAAAGKPQPELPLDLSGLQNLRASGTLAIGALKAANVKAANVRLTVKAAGGRLEVSPIQASLYQGTLTAALFVNAAGTTPAIAARSNLIGVSVGPLLKDLAGYDALEGRGNVVLELISQGSTASALKKALAGTAALELADGALRGIDPAGSIQAARAMLGSLRGEQTRAADRAQKTDFTELTASFRIANGVARNHDLALKSPLLRVGGEGEINLGEDTLGDLVKASLVATTQGQGGRERDELRGVTVPVRVSGPLAALCYRLGFSALAADTAKRAVAEQLQRRLIGGAAAPAAEAAKKEPAPQPGGGVRDRLRGLLGS